MPLAQYKNSRKDIRRAKELRQLRPMAEGDLWDALSQLRKETGLKFRRQQPLHPYIADFVCMTARLVIELDGPSHDTQQDYDAKRTAHSNDMGWTVMRFTNDEVRSNLGGVVQMIVQKAEELSLGVKHR